MDFRAAVTKARLYLAADATIPAGLLMLARAADALDPGQLDWNGVEFTHRGARLYLATGHLGNRILRAPGVALYVPTESAGAAHNVNVAQLAAWTRPYGMSDLPSLIGAHTAQFLRDLDQLWANRVAPLGLVNVERVRLVLAAGVLAVPASATVLRNLKATEDLVMPLGDGWAVPVAEFAKVMELYRAGNLIAAAQLARDSDASAERWAAVETAVQAVRDLPATVAMEAAKMPFRILGALGPANLVLAGVVILGGLVYFKGGAFVASTVRKLVRR